MRLSDSTEIACASVIVRRDDRQRRALELTPDFLSSIRQRGVMNPIIVDRQLVLVAGERRLAASIAVARATIPARFIDELTLSEAKVVELEENLKRKDLSWQDNARAICDIHRTFVADEPSWSTEETGDYLGLNNTSIWRSITVTEGIEGDAELASAATMSEALNTLLRRGRRAAANELDALLAEPTEDAITIASGQFEGALVAPAMSATSHQGQVQRAGARTPAAAPPESILCEDFCTWAPSYSGPKFNLIHCDFPYGVGVFDGGMANSAARAIEYDDSWGTFERLTRALVENLDRLMSISGHLVFWYGGGDEHEVWLREALRTRASRLDVWKHPLIWHKTDNAGMVASANYWPRHVYETALIASAGKRMLVRTAADHYGCPTDKSIHTSCKPVAMLKHFLGMLVDKHTSLLDPTCGSGSALRAAEELGAAHVIGLEMDEDMVEAARRALRIDRAKRAAERAIGA